MPVAIVAEPNVTMNGDIRKNATHRPLISPTARPLPIPAQPDHHERAGDAGQRDDRADREVETADDENQHLPGGHDDEVGRIAQHVEDVLQREKVRHEQCENDVQDDQRDQKKPDLVVHAVQPIRGRGLVKIAARARSHRRSYTLCRSCAASWRNSRKK
jgi:hypothetical protein